MREAGFLRCSAALRKLSKHGLVRLKHNEHRQEIWFFSEIQTEKTRDRNDWQNYNNSLREYPR